MSGLAQQNAEHLSETKLIEQESTSEARLPTILSFVVDKPNLITLLGLSLGLLASFFALRQNFSAAIIAMLWAVLMDWFDGLVARRMPGRSDAHRQLGAHMDSLVDLVTSATGPAILLLSIGEFSPWFFPGALAIVMAGVLRLAYFDVFGLDSNGAHAGLTIDNTPLAVAGVFLLYRFIGIDVFAGILYAAILVLACLHVAPFRMAKIGGRWYYAVTGYVIVLTVVYSFNLLAE